MARKTSAKGSKKSVKGQAPMKKMSVGMDSAVREVLHMAPGKKSAKAGKSAKKGSFKGSKLGC